MKSFTEILNNKKSNYFIVFAVFLLINVWYRITFDIFNRQLSTHKVMNNTRSSRGKENKFTVITENNTSVYLNYTLNTKGCKIIELTPFDKSVKRFAFKPKKRLCSSIRLTSRNSTHLWVFEDNFVKLNICRSNLVCCYSSFYRPDDIPDIRNTGQLDKRVRYKTCETFDVVRIYNEFIKVNCTHNGHIFIEYHVFMQLPKELPKAKDPKPRYNFLVLGIDSVSRMNFYRTMPKTQEFLNKSGAIDMFGYNKIGDNTFPNVMAMLCGLSMDQLKYTCWPNKKTTFDNCPFVWNLFKDAGYVTALGEDTSTIGTFNYLKNGFLRTPTDYYLHTFITEATKFFNKKQNICMGSEYYYNMLLNYTQHFMEAMKGYYYFGFFWEMTMTHDFLNTPIFMDQEYVTFLRTVKDLGYLNNTVLLVMSDHGMRWGSIRRTKQGRLEERLPFAYFLLPQEFVREYSSASENMRRNSHRLVTPFDLHETVKDLVSVKSIEDKMLAQRENESYADRRGISLFLPILENRTCETAEITDHWCTCQRSIKISVEDPSVRDAAKYLVEFVNEMLSDSPQCEKLILRNVISASVKDISITNSRKTEKMWQDYILLVRVDPSDALYEGTLRKQHGAGWSLTGTVSRINLYGNQSYCVDNARIKLYCYCK